MFRRVTLLLLLVAAATLVPLAPGAQAPPAGNEIRLVLLVVVDQFRFDYLTRFRSSYREGLDRLLREGAVFTNAYHDHYPTVTAVGHATMLSGATPAVSGIIGNDWFDRATGENVTSVSDPTTEAVGATAGASASPRRLLVSTLGDELKAASEGMGGEQSRVIGVSLKDRSAILPTGHRADGAYWYEPKTGTFATSTYYRADLPDWVTELNKHAASTFAGRLWEFAGAPDGSPGRALPAEPGESLYAAVYGSPFGNDLLVALAEAALKGEQLGTRGVTDLLSVSFSSNDSVGHTYGPDSPEVRDITLKMDAILGRLFATVDEVVGLERTLVVFTSDHGVAPVPEYLAERRMPGGRMSSEDLFAPIEAALKARFGDGRWIAGTAGSSPYLDYGLIAERELEPAEVRAVAAEAAGSVPHVARVYTRDQILRGNVPPDTIGRRVLRSYRADRSGDLEIILDPYWMRSGAGTTHGTPYAYDAHVPIVFMGPGIAAGFHHGTVAMNDIAPTLATLVGTEIPAGSSGRVLGEMLAAPAPTGHPAPTSAGLQQ